MTTRIVKWLSAFVVLVMVVVAVPDTAYAEGSASGTFPDRTFSVIRSTPGGPRTDALSVDILPTQTGNWWVIADTIAGPKVMVQVWRNDDGVLTLESSSRLSTVGEESKQTPLMAGLTYVATFTPFGKPGTSTLHEQYIVSGDIVWMHQFGTSLQDYASEVAVDDTGIYVAGISYWEVEDPYSGTIYRGSDVLVCKFDFAGNEVWTRQFDTSQYDWAKAIDVGASGVYVAGTTNGSLPGQTSAGGFDAFVRKYDHNGNEVWTRQFGTPTVDAIEGVGEDVSGVYVVGWTNDALPGQTGAGDTDAFVRKYDSSGSEIWTRQFGTPMYEYLDEIDVDESGVYVTGYTEGTLPGQTSSGDGDAFVRKYDHNGNEVWTRQFGLTLVDYGTAIVVDDAGLYVAGSTSPELHQYSTFDAFVRRYDLSGNEVWTCQVGTPLQDGAEGVAADESGVYVSGFTEGTLPGETSAGGRDAFVRKYDPDGNGLWTSQFGQSGRDGGTSIAVGISGLYVAGYTAPSYAEDCFVARLLP